MTLLDLRHAQHVSPPHPEPFTPDIAHLEECALGGPNTEADQEVRQDGVTGIHRAIGDALIQARDEPVELIDVKGPILGSWVRTARPFTVSLVRRLSRTLTASATPARPIKCHLRRIGRTLRSVPSCRCTAR